jgi:hypothetical protein
VQYPYDVLLALHEVLHQFLLMFVSFPRCIIASYARRANGRGSRGSTPSSITATIHNPIIQSKLATNLSVMN